MEEHTDDLHWGFKLVCSLLPLIGLIYFLSERKSQPDKAESALAITIAGIIVGLLFSL